MERIPDIILALITQIPWFAMMYTVHKVYANKPKDTSISIPDKFTIESHRQSPLLGFCRRVEEQLQWRKSHSNRWFFSFYIPLKCLFKRQSEVSIPIHCCTHSFQDWFIVRYNYSGKVKGYCLCNIVKAMSLYKRVGSPYRIVTSDPTYLFFNDKVTTTMPIEISKNYMTIQLSLTYVSASPSNSY